MCALVAAAAVAIYAAVSCRRSPVLQAGVMLRAHQAALRIVAGGGGVSAGCWSTGAVKMVRRRQENPRTVSVEDALRWAAGGGSAVLRWGWQGSVA